MSFQRNRIRHLLMPMLESYNPKFREATLRMSQSLKSDYTFVMETLEQAWGETVLAANDEVITFDAARLAACGMGLQRNLVKHAMQNLDPGVDVTYHTLERATHLIKSAAPSSRTDLKAGLRMIREANYIHICTPNAVLPFDRWPQMPGDEAVSISLPGQAALAGGWKVTCERWRLPALAKEQAEENDDPFQVWLDADGLPDSFILRTRHQGDHFSPLGLNGHSQKLSDFFVNEKLPQRARDRWPLLCAGDEIVWVPGHRPAHRHRLKGTTRNVIYFSVVRPLEKPSLDEISPP
jgi:tRNA(Ile)-lysidine synthase